MLPESELSFSYARSSGPGGQNVNKVNSKAVLRWNVNQSPSVSEDVKNRFRSLFPTRINEEGEVVLMSDRFRDQTRNRDDCREKLFSMLKSAMTPVKKRKKTKPTRSSKERRIQSKQRHSEKKRLRQRF